MNWDILIAEDEEKLACVLCDFFVSRGDRPVAVGDGAAAIAAAEARAYDCILLDVMMPGMDGRAACRALRARSDVPVVFLTALGDEDDQLLGFSLGADDYVTKPFSLTVLYAKVAALIRRSRGGVRDGYLRAGALSLDPDSRRAAADGREVALTPKEFALLETLLRHKGAVLSRAQLLAQCWGYDFDGDDRAVDTHIARLREKLGPAGAQIKTVIKAGYRLEG